MYNSLLEDAQITSLIKDTSGAPGSTYLDSANPVSMSGYDGCLLVAHLGVIPTGVTTGLARLIPLVGSSSGTLAPTTGSGEYAYSTALSTGNDDTYLVVDCKAPVHKFLGARLYKDSTNAFSGDVMAIRYRASNYPVTQSTADVTHSVTISSPTSS